MAAAHMLPPIQGAKGGGPSGMMGTMKHAQPVHFAPAPPRGPPSGRLKPLKKKPKEQFHTSSQQPVLTKRQTTAYRNTYKHNLCVDMLQNGFHLSFCELFALIRQQEDLRSQAGPESLKWNETLLKDQHEKLEMLKLHLTRAETAQRRGVYEDVYRARFELARYFQNAGDKWLSDHFFNTCLQTSNQVTVDGGKMQAEGFCNVALAQEENGDFFEASEHFEAYYQLAKENRDWITADDITFYTDACINLSRIYTTIGERVQAESNELMLEYLTKAYSTAKESQQQKLEGEAAYRLGLACDSAGSGETALVHQVEGMVDTVINEALREDGAEIETVFLRELQVDGMVNRVISDALKENGAEVVSRLPQEHQVEGMVNVVISDSLREDRAEVESTFLREHKVEGMVNRIIDTALMEDGAEVVSREPREHLNTYLTICRSTDDKEGIGKACDAIAKSFAREGKVKESIEYLKQFVEVAETSGQELAYSKACHNLGNIYNTLGKYDEATKYFDKAYNLSRSMGEVASINVNRVQFGVAQAHKMMQTFGSHIVLNHLPALERLIEWKSARLDDFEKPFPEPKVETPKSSTQAPLTPERENTRASASSEQGPAESDSQEREATGVSTAPSETDTTLTAQE